MVFFAMSGAVATAPNSSPSTAGVKCSERSGLGNFFYRPGRAGAGNPGRRSPRRLPPLVSRVPSGGRMTLLSVQRQPVSEEAIH
jgi:hypothetical protein